MKGRQRDKGTRRQGDKGQEAPKPGFFKRCTSPKTWFLGMQDAGSKEQGLTLDV